MTEIKYSSQRDPESLDKFRKLFLNDISSIIEDEEAIAYLELCVYEVIINVIDHSLLPEGLNSDISIIFTYDNSEIVIKINYYAKEFDFTQKKLPSIKKHFEEGKSRGLGVYMVRTLMDSYSYSFENNLNTITLKKKTSS